MTVFDFNKLATLIPVRGGIYPYTHMDWSVTSIIPIEQVLIDNGVQYTKHQVARRAFVLDVGDIDQCIHVYGAGYHRCRLVDRDGVDGWYKVWDKILEADALKLNIANIMGLSKEELKLLKWKL